MAVFLLLKWIQMLVTWMLTHHHVQGSLVWHADLCLQAVHLSCLLAKKGQHRALVWHTALGLQAVHPPRLLVKKG